MAYRQPKFHAPQRVYQERDQVRAEHQAQGQNIQIEESQEWILFSPAVAPNSCNSQITSTDQSRRTHRSQEVGSVETVARSYEYDDAVSEHDDGPGDEEDGELDSLDSHLHEFRAEPLVFQPSLEELHENSHAVLPTHDGLGSFRLNRTAMNEGVQEHLYSFERYNPRKHKRRRESLDLRRFDAERERTIDQDRIERIEEWRLAQSQALLAEVQRESRRQKSSRYQDTPNLINATDDAEAASLEDHGERGGEPEHEGFLSRLTRKVIQDLLGFDDDLLSILFGEALPDEVLSRTPVQDDFHTSLVLSDSLPWESWEHRLLDRVARELGLLISSVSAHPGAFSTYIQVRNTILPYAGLPIISETQVVQSREDISPLQASLTPEFQPTIPTTTQAIPIPQNGSSQVIIDVDATPRQSQTTFRNSSDDEVGFTAAEWERELDIKMVFRYLRSRFTSRSPSPDVLVRNTSRPTNDTSEMAARAARVRQHHPLLNRPPATERRTFRPSTPLTSPILHRRSSSSCASQHTRRSAKRNSGSSRHYWDINGSIGSGSLIASTGAMGFWGEV